MDRRNALKSAAIALIGVLTPWKKAQCCQRAAKETWLFFHYDRGNNKVDEYVIELTAWRSKCLH